jgi:AcrR family transcriptional regulator
MPTSAVREAGSRGAPGSPSDPSAEPEPAPVRERAPRMSPEARRAAIVAAALPLVVRHGSGVLTADIAAAAGIAEGTIFRVFPDKEALLAACLASVADTTEVHEQLVEIDDESLEPAVARAIDVVLAHLATAMPVVMRVTTTGPTPRAARGLRVQLTDQTRLELAEVLEAYADQLSLPVEEAAGILHVLVLGAAVQPEPPSSATLARVFVAGISA